MGLNDSHSLLLAGEGAGHKAWMFRSSDETFAQVDRYQVAHPKKNLVCALLPGGGGGGGAGRRVLLAGGNLAVTEVYDVDHGTWTIGKHMYLVNRLTIS